MNQKTTWYILAAVVLAAAAVYFGRPAADDGDSKKPEKEQSLFSPAPGEVTAAEISLPDKPTTAFSRVDGKWRITEPIKTAAAAWAVEGAITRVKDLKYVSAFRAGDADRPTDDLTGLNKPIRVKLTDKDGKAIVLKVGQQVPAARQTYVQKEGDETIYVAATDLRPDLEKSLNDLRDRRVTEFVPSEATRVEVSGEERYTLAKAGEIWTLEQPSRGRADKAAVDGLLSAASNLNASTFVDDAPKNLNIYGLQKPSLTVVIHGEKRTPKPPPATQSTQPAAPEFDVKPWSVTVALGAKTGDKRFARIGEDASVFQVMDASVKTIVPSLESLRDRALTRVDVNRATKISVSSPAGAAELIRNNALWELAADVMPGLSSRQAEFSAVDDLLRAVRDLKATGFEAGDDSLKDFGFAKPAATIEITAEGSVEPVKLVVGGQTPSGTGAYIRNERENFVAVVKSEDAAALAVGPLNFVNRDLLTFERMQVKKIELNKSGQSATMEEAAGTWKFAAPIAGEAEATAVNTLLTDLSALRARRIVGGSAQMAEFGLDQPAVRCTLTIQPPAPPKPATQPTTGPTTQPPDPPPPPPVTKTVVASRKDGKAYVHVDGTPVIGEVDGRIFENLDVEFFDRRVTRLQTSDVTVLAIAREGQPTLRFERTGEEWALAGEPSFACDKPKISETITNLTSMKVVRFVSYQGGDPAKYALDRPQVAVTVRAGDGVEQELRIAPKGPEGDATGQRFATVSGTGRIFVVSKDDLAKFEKDVKNFQKAQ